MEVVPPLSPEQVAQAIKNASDAAAELGTLERQLQELAARPMAERLSALLGADSTGLTWPERLSVVQERLSSIKLTGADAGALNAKVETLSLAYEKARAAAFDPSFGKLPPEGVAGRLEKIKNLLEVLADSGIDPRN